MGSDNPDKMKGSIPVFTKWQLPAAVFLMVFSMLSAVMLFVDAGMLVLERFISGGGWIQIAVTALYGSFLAAKMQNPLKSAKWRKLSWSVFSVVFFSQLILGLSGLERFLMTGELHLPVPAMIISGPIYRAEISFMALLFLSTVLLTGPAWCSHFCYFGGLDSQMASGRTSKKIFNDKFRIRHTILVVFIGVTLALRILNVSSLYATLLGIAAGLAGLVVMGVWSSSRKKMAHCTLYCPVGTVVAHLKRLNPFRMYIHSDCSLCMACMRYCKYDALYPEVIREGKPDASCTYCGDCIGACHKGSIRYGFPGLSHRQARWLYLFLTVSIHAVFMALARI